MNHESYCKIYINCNINKFELINLISALINGKIEFGNISSEKITVDVFGKVFPDIESITDDFVHWPFYLEAEALDEVSCDFPTFLNAIALLIIGLKNSGLHTVASCSFEDELNNLVLGVTSSLPPAQS